MCLHGSFTLLMIFLQCFIMIFINEPNKGVNPDEVVSIGAAIQGNDLNAIQSASQALQNDLQAVGQAAYQQTPPQGQPGDQTPPPSPDDGEDVIDGEYKET